MPDSGDRLVPSEVDLKLCVGIFRLLDAKYCSRFGDRSKFLCAGIFNWVFLEPPGNDEAKSFVEANRGRIEREAMAMYLDSDLALAVSIRYTFMLILLGPSDPERLMNIVDRATELNIAIRSTKELYPGADAFQFLAFIDEYASRLLGPKT